MIAELLSAISTGVRSVADHRDFKRLQEVRQAEERLAQRRQEADRFTETVRIIVDGVTTVVPQVLEAAQKWAERAEERRDARLNFVLTGVGMLLPVGVTLVDRVLPTGTVRRGTDVTVTAPKKGQHPG